MNRVKALFISIMAFSIWAFGYSFMAYVAHNEGFVSDQYATEVWMVSDAIAKCLIILTSIVLSTGYLHQWLMFVFAVAVNNLLDELLFDPYTLGYNECAITILLAIYYTHNICKAVYASR